MRTKASITVLCCIFAACAGSVTQMSETLGERRIVTDDLGRTVDVPRSLSRVVSLAPNLTESVFAIGGGDRLVGVTTFCDYPEEAKSIAKIGDTMNPNLESIVALKPDLVLVSTASQVENFSRTLSANDIAVFVTNPDDMEGVLRNLETFGKLLGKEAEAAKVTGDLRRRLDGVVRSAGRKRLRTFVQISREPLFTIGRQSFLTAALKLAGADSVTAHVESAYPKLSKETALALAPELIILSASEDNLEPNEVFRYSPAVKNGRVISIDADLISRPGPRLVDAIERVASVLNAQPG